MNTVMKKRPAIFFAVLPLACCLFLFGFMPSGAVNEDEAGIEFFHGTFNEALQKAKSENKLVFVDAYTTWCGPCRWMAVNTFTDAAVGEYFNEHFVSLKLDMERGEGPDFARKYRVMAYPTLLFMDGTGQVVKKSMGAKKAAEFLKEGQAAISSRATGGGK